MKNKAIKFRSTIMFLALLFQADQILAAPRALASHYWASSPGIVGTLVVTAFILVFAIIIFLVKLNGYAERMGQSVHIDKNELEFSKELTALKSEEIDTILQRREKLSSGQSDKKLKENNSNDKKADKE